MHYTRGGPGRALASMVGVLAFSLPEPVLVTVRQADRYASPADFVAASVSADGRYVAFASFARLVAADTNDRSDIYVLDRLSGSVTIESLAADGRAAIHDSSWPRISGDGRFVVYDTMPETVRDVALRIIMLRDRRLGTSRIIQRGDQLPNWSSREPAISSDGRIVVFSSCATNLTEDADANDNGEDVYAYDTSFGRLERLSITTDGRQPLSGSSFAPSVSADGRYVAFTSTSDLDLSLGAAQQRRLNRMSNVYVRDRHAHVTRRISDGRDGGVANGRSYGASISGDGRRIVFVSDATNLVAGDDNRFSDIFLYDVLAHTTTLVSRSASGGSANGPSTNPAIAANGDVIAFQSEASDLTCSSRCPSEDRDINLVPDVFVFEPLSRATTRVSTGRQSWMEPSAGPSLSGTGAIIAFSSRHAVDASDTANDFDLFVSIDRPVGLTSHVSPR